MFENLDELEKEIRKKFDEMEKDVDLKFVRAPSGKLVVDFKFKHLVDECVGWCTESLEATKGDCQKMCNFELISSFVVNRRGEVEEADIAIPFTRTEKCAFAWDETKCEYRWPEYPFRNVHFHMNSSHEHIKCPTVDDLFDYIAACLG